MPPFEVIGVGSLNIDRVYSVRRVVTDGAQLIDEMAVAAGGCSANTTYALAKLGLRCGFLGALGDDAEAQMVLRSFAEVGVDTRHIVRKKGLVTGSVLAFADGHGNRAMYTEPGANAFFQSGDLDAAYLASARLALFSSFGGAIPLDVQRAAVEALQPTTVISLSIDSLLAPYGLDALAELLSRCTIAFANVNELRELTKLELPAAAEALVDLGCQTVVVTFGRGTIRQPWMTTEATAGEGEQELPIFCWLLSGEGRWALPAGPIHEGPIVDATGAGDAFAAGFLWGFLMWEPLPHCAALGHVAAGFCLASMGCRAGLPTREDLLAYHAHYFG
ncbi:MAG: carbohydrate kinase family protein [Dehalococcoidia bacterium]|nr:carbohydrate kinase family protein [Dehalococcoidia bacterium]